ncbi:MAG: DegQ family serine endoprotease, partial [Candidatus Latescibacterota bacterium]
QAYSDGIAELAAQVKPSVVAISAEVVTETGGEMANPFAGTPFEDFFGRQHPGFQIPRGQERHSGLGSGVIVSRDGYILTNNHVVTGEDRQTVAAKITVELLDKRTFPARVVGRDPLSDLAVLKVEAGSLPALPFGDSDRLRVGEVVMAVGNPFRQFHTVTTGIVSAVGRGHMGLAEYEDFVQTDAAINPGNSGGALVNTRGELIAINTAIIGAGSPFGGNVGSTGVGFAIPVNMARSIMRQLIDNGQVRRGLLGVSIQPIDKEVASAMGVTEARGVLVGDVTKGSAADGAGIRRGDIILSLNGEPVNEVNALRNRIAMTAPGTAVVLGVLRDGAERAFTVKLGQREGGEVAAGGEREEKDALGFRVQELTPEIARQLGYEGESGVLIASVAQGSEAQDRGLQRGDLIQEVNRQPVDSVEVFGRAMKASAGRESVLLLVKRGDSTRYLAVPAPAK